MWDCKKLRLGQFWHNIDKDLFKCAGRQNFLACEFGL